jgi:predicted ribosomally synthesized peptide with nif11-like leader
MSVKSVKDFFEKVEADKALQAKLKALDKTAREATDAAIGELVAIGKAEGFAFTAQDFIDAKTERPADGGTAPAHGKGVVTDPGCLMLAGCGHNHPMWTLDDPPAPCGQGTAYIPHGHGRS